MMKTQKRQFDKQRGAALILVVVVTVLLAVVGVMFLMVSRLGEMESVAVADQRDLNAAVQTTVSRINAVLVEDLFGDDNFIINADSANKNPDESSDYPAHNPCLTAGPDGIWGTADDVFINGSSGTWTDPIDPGANGTLDPSVAVATNDDIWLPGKLDDFWLASLEPTWSNDNGTPADPSDDIYVWPHVTDLWGTLQGEPDGLYFQQFVQSDHLYYPQTASKFWLDPDDETMPAQWATDASIWDAYQVSVYNVRAKVIKPADRMKVILQGAPANMAAWDDSTNTSSFGARADADGDGVADSRWVKIPTLTTSRGKDVFAAVRIIDNCAMLNLNAAHCFYQGEYADNVSLFEKPWFQNISAATAYHENKGTGSGRYLTEINYLPFLRGRDLNGALFGSGTPGLSGDNWYNLMIARGSYNNGTNLPFSPKDCYDILMNIENPGDAYQLFDISDELEIRNRYLLSSFVQARYEQKNVANYTLDPGDGFAGGKYVALRIPRDETNFDAWKIRVNPDNFDVWSGGLATDTYKYDRRHVCTFYSFDRNLRKGEYPLVGSEIAAYLATNSPLPPGFSSMREYEEYLWTIFTPKGAVTTDIRVPVDIAPGIQTYYNSIETRKRILHLLYALREYYYQRNGNDLNAAALSAAQVVANLIDFSDDDAVSPTPPDRQGPFFDAVYGGQMNVDCTFITEQIVEDMIAEVSGGFVSVGVGLITFGLNPAPTPDVVFGYERQPFISEVYAKRNPSTGVLEGFAIELLNPYSDDLKLVRIDTAYNANDDAWRIKVGDGLTVNHPISDLFRFVPKYDQTNKTPGRYVIRTDFSVTLAAGPLAALTYELPVLSQMNSLVNKEIQLLRPAPANSGVSFIVVDRVSSEEVNKLWLADNQSAIKRQDTGWKFIYPSYELQQEDASNYTHTLGQQNGVTITGLGDGFQLDAADDQNPLCRWHELETLSLYGNGADGTDPNAVITVKLTNNTPKHFDLAGASSGLLDYLCTMNRPELGSLPGRININTAAVHVIAAAIPPTLADPANPPTISALQLAQTIVDNRPYEKLSDLLTKVPRMKQYFAGGVLETENVGQQSIEDDIEERDWILSNLANKFTVRSDTFTAYILVRLGEDGPQRRMIAIFDRSQVWKPTDRPKLVALHPVPDPR